MLPEQETLLYDNFVELVHDYNLEGIIRSANDRNPVLSKILDNIKFVSDELIKFNIINYNRNSFGDQIGRKRSSQ